MHYLLLGEHLQEYSIHLHSKQYSQRPLALRLVLLRHTLVIQQSLDV